MTDSSEILANGSAAMRRYHDLPRWRILARHNAWNRFMFLTKLGRLQAEIEASTPPERRECPICAAWENPTCDEKLAAMREP